MTTTKAESLRRRVSDNNLDLDVVVGGWLGAAGVGQIGERVLHLQREQTRFLHQLVARDRVEEF